MENILKVPATVDHIWQSHLRKDVESKVSHCFIAPEIFI